MILHLGFAICVEADNGHEVHCTIVQESDKESKPKQVQYPVIIWTALPGRILVLNAFY